MPVVRGSVHFLLFVVLMASTGIAEDTLWVSLRGTAAGRGTCRWHGQAPAPEIREWHFTSKTNRRYKMGLAVWASPAVAVIDGRPMAFIGGYDQTMHALYLAEKDRSWFKITNGEIAAPPAVGLVGGRQVVFWGSADRTVYAHYAGDGERLWTHELVRPTNTMGDAHLSAPLLHDGVLYITCFVYDKALPRNDQKGWLFALDMADGRPLWQYEVSQGMVSSPVGRTLDGRFVVYVAARRGALHALDVSRGHPVPLWYFQMPHEVLGSPVVEEGTSDPLLFLGSKFGNLIAIDARTGEEKWQRMAGNWIDNTACIGEVDGRRVVFVGSHDYNVYAFRASDGELLWRRRLGGEAYAAPCFFELDGEPALAAAALDNHLYIINARDGTVITSYFTGTPIWDKVAKGDTVWGSPVAFEAGEQTALVHGSFNDTVYVLPLEGECSLRSQVRSAAALWYSLGAASVAFLGVVLPLVLWLTRQTAKART